MVMSAISFPVGVTERSLLPGWRGQESSCETSPPRTWQEREKLHLWVRPVTSVSG